MCRRQRPADRCQRIAVYVYWTTAKGAPTNVFITHTSLRVVPVASAHERIRRSADAILATLAGRSGHRDQDDAGPLTKLSTIRFTAARSSIPKRSNSRATCNPSWLSPDDAVKSPGDLANRHTEGVSDRLNGSVVMITIPLFNKVDRAPMCADLLAPFLLLRPVSRPPKSSHRGGDLLCHIVQVQSVAYILHNPQTPRQN